ncbi:MAG: ATP-binding protein [Clostridiales Family XIII bacterium]|jgi:AAA+ ATPase superfamily predicted ATPase|nr:ATP-binding protein [Clostridiales Family XIII bacterium]
MFTGRSAELKKLNEMYGSGSFECAIIYGRRRVGKTTLIKEFIKGKKAVYFLAREADGRVNLRGFSNDVYAVTAKELKGKSFFSDWERAFDYIYQISRDNRLVLVIDEYPYLADGYRPISSIVQTHIDDQFKGSKLFLILCGSSTSFMEEQVLSYKSPLYGRRTAQFKVLPFSFFESLPFLEGFGKEEKAALYGMLGGVPDYLNKINPSKTMRENITGLFFTASGSLYEEPSNLLKQELRDPTTYNGIIEAIADGASRLNEIATKCGMESNKCAKYLKSLISLGIVKKEFPVTEPSTSKKSIYLLDDMMFRFWYRFVFPNMSGVVSGLGEAIYDFDVEDGVHAYMGFIFEEICKQYLLEEAKRNALPFFIGNLGRWWGNNPKEKRQEEIDILAFRKENALFCECKWTRSPVDIDVLNDLKAQSELFSYRQKWLWLFAKTGFTDRLVRESEKLGNVRLIPFDEMI